MKNYVKVIGVLVAGLLLANCSSTTYNMKSEKGKVLNKVPGWYMNDFKVKKECGTTKFGKNKNKECIFGVGTAVSPDLQLAIEKAVMIAKPSERNRFLAKLPFSTQAIAIFLEGYVSMFIS